MPNTPQAPTYNEISQWLALATDGDGSEKNAGAKSASEMDTSGEGTKDPGGYKGPSSHPSARNASNTEAAPMGARAKENESDNKEDRGPASVDSTSPGPADGGQQDDQQIHIGMNPSSTGEDSSVEDDYKGDKEDGTTAHPADAKDVGEKYSSWDLDKLCKTAEAFQNDILANITMGFGFDDTPGNNQSKPDQKPKQKQASQQQEAPKQTSAEDKGKSQDNGKDQNATEAGYELASAMGFSKQAADENVNLFLAGLMKEAYDDADRVGACLKSYYDEQAKQASKPKQKPKPTQKKAEGSPESDNGEDHAGPGGGEEIPPEILAAAQGAGGPEGGMPPGGPEGGGMLPPGGPEGGGGGDIQELAMALMEAGIPPEHLPELIAAAMGGEGGGGPEGGGMPPPPGGAAGAPPVAGGPPGPAEMGAKIASAVQTYQRSGKFRYTEAKTAEQRRRRDAMKNYILEIAGQR